MEITPVVQAISRFFEENKEFYYHFKDLKEIFAKSHPGIGRFALLDTVANLVSGGYIDCVALSDGISYKFKTPLEKKKLKIKLQWNNK